jgi:hypothetical protein
MSETRNFMPNDFSGTQSDGPVGECGYVGRPRDAMRKRGHMSFPDFLVAYAAGARRAHSQRHNRKAVEERRKLDE